MATTLGSMAVGSTVKVTVNGSARDFIVVHQGKPHSAYADSCNGTWLLMKENYIESQYDSSNLNDFANSSIHSYLNSTFYNQIEENIRSNIKQIKLPYRPGSGYDANGVWGEDGLSTKIFLLSSAEVNFDTNTNNAPVREGATLSFFSGFEERDSRRACGTYWFLRSPACRSRYGSSVVFAVYRDGGFEYVSCNDTYGIRPAFVLSTSLLVSDDGTVTTNTSPSMPSSILIPDSINGGTSINVSWGASSDAEGNLAGYKVEKSTNGGSSWSQIYQGTALSTVDAVAFGIGSVMYRVKAYDSEGLESGYRTSNQVTVFNNHAPSAPPSITVPNTVKGGGTLVVSWTAASDSDGNLSGYILERSTDGGSNWSQIYNGASLSYTDSINKGWSSVTYRVKAYDSYGAESGYTTSAARTVDNNTAPTIACSSGSDLGTKNSGFSVGYSVDDVDTADTLTVTEKLDNVQKRSYTPTRGANNSFAVTGEYFQKILNGTHSMEIAVTDGKETVKKAMTFTKSVTAASVSLAEPMEADAQIKLCAITVAGSIPADAAFKVEVTNNAKDSSPVWEDCTNESLKSRNYVFSNMEAANGFAFNFRVTVSRGASGEGGYITSIQGGFQ